MVEQLQKDFSLVEKQNFNEQKQQKSW